MRPTLLALLLSTLGVTATGAQDAASAVRAANRAIMELTLHRDADALDRAIDDRLIWIDPDGSVKNKSERLAPLRSGAVRFQTLVIDEEDARCFEPACLVIGRYYYFSGGVAAGIRFLRVFVNRDGRWLLLVHHGTRLAQPHESSWAPATGASSSTLPNVSGVEADLVQMYQTFTDAVGRNDVRVLERIYGHDYRFHSWRGGVDDKQGQTDAVRTGRIRQESAVVDEVQVRIVGELGVVSGRRSQLGQGNMGARPRLVRHTAVFLNRGGRWEMVAGQVAPVLTTPSPEGFSTS